MASYKDFMNKRIAEAQANRASRQGNPTGMQVNPGISIMQDNQLQPNGISPTAFSNQDTINAVFGQSNPNTFTRSIGQAPISQMPAQDIDAGMPMQDTNENFGGMGGAQLPPIEVQTPITPTYDLNNL